MADPTPRWQFKLSDLFVACSLVAVFFAIFTALPLKFEHDDYRIIPAVVFTAWIGCVFRQLRKGRLWSRPRTVASLLVAPILGAGEYVVVHPGPPEDQSDLLVLIVSVSLFAAGGVVLSLMYGRSSKP